MKALIFKNIVVQLEENEFPVSHEMQWMNAPQDCKVGWILENGQLKAPPEPDKTNAEKIQEYKEALKELLNKKAIEKDYDNETSIVSYKNSTNETWSQEAADFIAWRDLCWQYAIDVQTDVEAGSIEPPTLDDFIANAPVLNWS